MRSRPLRFGSLAFACALVAAGCGSGKSIIVAGNDTPTATTVPVPPGTGPPQARPFRAKGRSAPGTTPGEQAGDHTTSDEPPRRRRRSRRCGLPGVRPRQRDQARHHVLARPHHDKRPHQRITDDYNASQNRVHVVAENQNGYLETIDKFFQSTVDDRPEPCCSPTTPHSGS
jgi:hypothetical protein